jgi:hypothetical protein
MMSNQRSVSFLLGSCACSERGHQEEMMTLRKKRTLS